MLKFSKQIIILKMFFRDEQLQRSIKDMEVEAELLETVNTFEEKRHKKWIENLDKKQYVFLK